MTDRRTSHHPAESNPPGNREQDVLVKLYHRANAEDASASGPSTASSERVLAYAQTKAAQRAAATPQDAAEPTALQAAPSLQSTFNGEPANDRRWLRNALGSLAALGLVGLLTLQHLNEPGAPQLDSPASAPRAPTPAPSTESAPIAANAAATASEAEHTEEKMAVTPAIRAPETIKPEALQERRQAPAAQPHNGNSDKDSHRFSPTGSGASAPEPAQAPASASGPPAQRPTPPAAIAHTSGSPGDIQADASAVTSASASADMAAPPAPATLPKNKERMDELATLNAKSTAKAASLKPLPYCDEKMDAEAQSEQIRRIKAREQAKVAGKPLPEPAPVCKPLPKKLTTPEITPVDSR
ncbi:MAG: hypothetical protein RSF42_13055 [Comamonas sp.]